MPTSVLLAILVAAGLLALAPALVRRYDASERLLAERADSAARVLQRSRRRRTVPGRRPVNATRRVAAPASDYARDAGRPLRVVSGAGRRAGSAAPIRSGSGPRRSSRRPYATAAHRRRRVLAALLLLNLAELAGVVLVGPGFWVGFAATGTLLATYVVHLRNRAIRESRRRRTQAREAAWLAARQAEVRRQQARRAVARREAQRRMAAEREAVRRTAMGLDGRSDLSEAVGGSISYRRLGGRRAPA